MSDRQFELMGVNDPNRPVTRGEVAQYVARVILAERARIARALWSAPYREDQARAIADPQLDPDVFGWS